MSHEELVGRIYEAAVLGDQWADVLHRLARTVDSVGTTLFVADAQQVTTWVASEGLDRLMREWVEGRWNTRTERTSRMFQLRRPGFVQDSDVYTPEELDRDESYVHFLRPNGLGRGAGTFVEIPSGDRAVFSIERPEALGAYSADDIARLDALRPHLARAAILATRTQLARAGEATRLLDSLGLPAAVLGRDQRVLLANDRFEALPEIVMRAFNRIGLQDRHADAVVQQRLEQATAGGVSASFPLQPGGDARPLVMHLLPVARAAHDVFAQGLCLAVVTPVTSELDADMGLIAGLFDLTPAESRVVSLIARGQGVGYAAGEIGVSRETVRSQLKRALAKLGVRGQAELTALVASVARVPAAPRPADPDTLSS